MNLGQNLTILQFFQERKRKKKKVGRRINFLACFLLSCALYF